MGAVLHCCWVTKISSHLSKITPLVCFQSSNPNNERKLQEQLFGLISVFLFVLFFAMSNSTALRFSSTASRQSIHRSITHVI